MKSTIYRRYKWRFWLVLVLVVLTLGYIAVLHFSRKVLEPATSTIHRGNLESSVLATGIMKPRTLVAIGAQATGRILALKVKPGQRVNKNDVVAIIDSTSQQNDLQKTQATLQQNEATRDQDIAQLDLAKLDLARNLLMVRQSAIARSEYEKSVSIVKEKQAQLRHTEATIAASKIEVQIAKTNLAYTRITAPMDGTVLATVVQEGQTVNASQSAPTIAILGNLDTMTVEADISEADVTHVRAGLPLYFTISGQSAKRYEATLKEILPAPDSIVNDKSFSASSSSAQTPATASAIYYKGLFSVANPDGALKTYMTAEIHIVLAKASSVLVAPVSALHLDDEDGSATVRVLSAKGDLVQRTDETGITDKINTEIKSGLRDGERVLTDNQTNETNEQSSSVSIGF
ncbi:efflux RND transporter periplasmic adaptor subunit [Ochrobactrum sp. BTU1]|uniref:efflux RND transporter periplasmic adaptor subunit n=1 Tax=Ochrobactrum sp. BTU1 TaxID=2840456 RepID=UPI001C03F9DB|nr:efflux RND transporter periplasmic adaptor subunit [Ochrobactrum sp. BTU1]